MVGEAADMLLREGGDSLAPHGVAGLEEGPAEEGEVRHETCALWLRSNRCDPLPASPLQGEGPNCHRGRIDDGDDVP
jgi:hypothetical protein